MHFLCFSIFPPPSLPPTPRSFLSLSFLTLLSLSFYTSFYFPSRVLHPGFNTSIHFFSNSFPSLFQFLPCLSFPFNLLLLPSLTYSPFSSPLPAPTTPTSLFFPSSCPYYSKPSSLPLFLPLLLQPLFSSPLPAPTTPNPLFLPSSCPYYSNPPFLPSLRS